jgi:hypothetical protein
LVRAPAAASSRFVYGLAVDLKRFDLLALFKGRRKQSWADRFPLLRRLKKR